MTHALLRTETPEEREYARYLGEIEAWKRRVADLQADLAAYKEQLGRFSAEYHTRVGVLFVELDRIELVIAEYEFRIAKLRTAPHVDPDELERKTKEQFTEQREQIHEDEEETRYYEREHREEQKRPELDEESEATLKALFRELAKRFHPDLAKTDVERQQRETIMKQINAAFHERDIDQLRIISQRHDIDDAAFEAKSIGEKLVWAIREVSRLNELIESTMAEHKALEASELCMLWRRQQGGENVIEQLERDLKQKTDVKRRQVQTLIDEFQSLVHEAHRV